MRKSGKKRKAVFLTFQNTFAAKFSDLCGKSAALDLEIVGELLTVERDIEAIRARELCTEREVSEELIARGALGGDLDALVEAYVLLCNILHQVEYHLRVKAADV